MNFNTTHTKPGFSKANKTLSVSDYTKLLQIAAEARKLQDTVPASTVSGKSAENEAVPAGEPGALPGWPTGRYQVRNPSS